MARIVRDPGTAVSVPSGWTMARVPAGGATHPDELPGDLDWIAAVVPGTVAQALEAAGLWDRRAPTPLHVDDFWFRAALHGDGLAWLRCEGLAGLARLWLDGRELAASDSMFRTVETAIDVRGEGTLLVHFRSLTRALAGRRRGRWRPRLMRDPAIRTVRQTLLGQMPGWCPDFDIIGPYRPIVMLSRLPPTLDLRTDWTGAGGHVTATLRDSGAATATLTVGGTDIPLTLRDGVLTGAATLPGVAAWWPHTHGEPALHPARIALPDRTLELEPIGFRRVEVDRGPDGGGFGLVWNGTPIFCRGASWTPPDLVALGEPAATETALRQARALGLNMLRLPGTGTYETDAFHAACDRLGILVWQDFMFASMDYPANDAAFRATVAAEAAELLDRRQTSPSLAVLCGGTEVAQQAAMLGLGAADWTNAIFEEVLPAAVAAARPDVPYAPHSPGGGGLPFSNDFGISHYYGVGAYLRPLDDGGLRRVRFASECLAIANVPEASSLEATLGAVSLADPAWTSGAPRDGGVAWDFADVRDCYLERLTGLDARMLRRTDAQRYLELSRAVSCELADAVFGVWRDPAVGCGGGLVWLLRDLKPGAGWGIVDIAGAPKPVWHALRKIWSDPAVLVTDAGLDGLALCVVNERATPLRGRLSIRCLRHGQTEVASGAQDIEVPARGSLRLSSAALFGRFFDVTYAYRFGPPAHDVSVVELTDPSGALLADATHRPHAPALQAPVDVGLSVTIDADGEDWLATITVTRFSQYVHFRHEGLSATPDWLHIWPSRPRTIRLVRAGGTLALDGEVSAINGLNAARYRVPA